jgi:hypothetical protein
MLVWLLVLPRHQPQAAAAAVLKLAHLSTAHLVMAAVLLLVAAAAVE